METYTAEILWLHRSSTGDQDRIGSKAARLGDIQRAGFQVPPGFSLPVSAYRQHVLEAAPSTYWDTLERQDLPHLRAWIMEREIDPLIRQALLNEYSRLLAQAPSGVAVRSTSTAEDLQRHSFAGLYNSILNVSGEQQLLDAVRECWASYWSDEAVTYRVRAGIPHTAHGMAVLVQAMVPAVLAGVLYTQASAETPNIALIEFTREGGDALANGETRATSLFIDRAASIPVTGTAAEHSLDASQLLSIGQQLENMLGAPQDIEWALDGSGCLWILQSRPITRQLIAQLNRQQKSESSHENHHSDDWLLTYDEPFSTLGCEIAVQRYHCWVKGINASFKTRFKPEIQDRDGLLYYHPTWRKVGPALKVWMNFWRLATWIGSDRVLSQYVDKIHPGYSQRLEAIRQVDLASASDATLMKLFRDAIQRYLDFQFTSYAIGAAATLSAELLDRASRHLFGSHTQWNALDFLTGIDHTSIQRELDVFRLGQQLRRDLASFGQQPNTARELEPFLNLEGQSGEVWSPLRDFIERYGYLWADRYPRDPAWEINPETITAALWIATQATPEENLETRHLQQQRRRAEAVQQAQTELSNPAGFPGKKLIFNLLLRRAEKLFPYKENRNHDTYAGMMVIRKVAREIGRRMYSRQILPSAEDLFFLKINEIEMLITDPASASRLLPMLKERKTAYDRSRQHIQQRVPAVVKNGNDNHRESIEINGDSCSPGLASGPARLINGPGDMQLVRPGEVVVCTQLRPAWSTVFSRAAGLVIENGSLLSHGSALAREYGIPAVINVSNITGLVRDTDWLVIDGNLGRVVIKRHPVQIEEVQA